MNHDEPGIFRAARLVRRSTRLLLERSGQRALMLTRTYETLLTLMNSCADDLVDLGDDSPEIDQHEGDHAVTEQQG